jgi:hypothetical protein
MTALNTNNYVSQAQMHRHTLALGLTSADDIVSWAKYMIINLHIDDQNLIKLVSCNHLTSEQILVVLGQFGPLLEDDTWWRMMKKTISHALEEGKIQAEKVVSYFYDLALAAQIPPYDCEALYQFELEYACLNEGFASQSEVDNKVKEFFKKIAR